MGRYHAYKQAGSVSLFLVILTALLVTTVTVAFVRLMVTNQEQATANDLSRSALDSAYAGVEDAKRAIVTYRVKCIPDQELATPTECASLQQSLGDASRPCNTIQRSGIAGAADDTEVLIKRTATTAADELLQQAYTCVRITLTPNDFIGILKQDVSKMVPLKGTAPFNEIAIEWFSQKDLQSAVDADGNALTDIALVGEDQSGIPLPAKALPKLADWPRNRPALLRTQLIQIGDEFRLSEFDSSSTDNTNNASLFMMPSLVGAGPIEDPTSTKLNFNADARRSPSVSVLQEVKCNPNFSTTSIGSSYACSTMIRLPNAVGENDATRREAYLRLTSLYNPNTSFRIMLFNDGVPVLFDNVQPEVDSTGRANDFFRRVKSRVELDTSNIPYVEAAVDLSGSLCKTFTVTDQANDFSSGDCRIE